MKNHGALGGPIDDPAKRASPLMCILAWLALCAAGWLLVGAAIYGLWCAYRIIAG